MWIWDPARSHNGITNKFAFSFSVGERKIMEHSFENRGQRDFVHFKQSPSRLRHSTWIAGIQVNMEVSGSILASLEADYPCRHDGVCVFILYGRA
jgi:hypothetical protein